MIEVRCLFFASLADTVGRSEGRFEVPDGAAVSQFLDQLESKWPGLTPYRGRYRVAVQQEFVTEEHPLAPGVEVALLPPVSGGEDDDLVAVTEEPLSTELCLERVRRQDCGAVSLFLGTVRDHNAELPVSKLEYTAYREMAEKEMARLVDEAHRRFQLGRVAAVHRVGVLEPGDIAVVVAVSSHHREPAFQASRWLIDSIKSTVPLWKKESGPDGSVWIEGDARIPR